MGVHIRLVGVLMGRSGLLLALTMGAPLAAFTFADEIYLIGGGKVTGEIVERTAQKVVVETGPGRVTLPMARVTKIEASHSALAEFRERARKLRAEDVEGWIALGRWAEARDLSTQASEAYRKAVAADPTNAEANRALGRTDVGGRWLTREEAYREQGLVPFEGSWVTPAEREAALRERSAAEAIEQGQREAEARVREAEARARVAEAEAQRAEAEAGATSSDGIPYWPYVYPGGGVVYPGGGLLPTHPNHPACCRPDRRPRPVPAPPTPPPSRSLNDVKSGGGSSAQNPPAKAVPRTPRAHDEETRK